MECIRGPWPRHERDAENRLTAAAPDLLAALKYALDCVSHWQRDAECNLVPTESSLARAAEYIRATIDRAEDR